MLRITGLWKNTKENGYIYYTGKLNDQIRVVLFPNHKKTSDSQPDFELFFDDNKSNGAMELAKGIPVGVKAYAPRPEPKTDGSITADDNIK